MLVFNPTEIAMAVKCLHLFWPDVKYRVDLPTEASGLFAPVDKWDKLSAFQAGDAGSIPAGSTIDNSKGTWEL